MWIAVNAKLYWSVWGVIAQMRSINWGNLECLEFMLATNDLLSHHMRILLPDQRGLNKIQAKYMENSSCHLTLIPLFWLRVWWGREWPWNHSPAKKLLYPRESEASVYSWSSGGEVAWVSKKRDTPFHFRIKCCHIEISLRKPELRRMCQWGNLIPFVRWIMHCVIPENIHTPPTDGSSD